MKMVVKHDDPLIVAPQPYNKLCQLYILKRPIFCIIVYSFYDYVVSLLLKHCLAHCTKVIQTSYHCHSGVLSRLHCALVVQMVLSVVLRCTKLIMRLDG